MMDDEDIIGMEVYFPDLVNDAPLWEEEFLGYDGNEALAMIIRAESDSDRTRKII